MRPSFNTAGPCFPDEHYMVPPERRLGRVLELIEQGKYFTLTAGRQTGKTTSLFWLVDHLNAAGKLRALWVDIQTAREQPDPGPVMRTVLGSVMSTAERVLADIALPSPEQLNAWLADPASALHNLLSFLASASAKPLVVLIDEADGLVGPAMVSFLTQLRAGYIGRRTVPFPHSAVLVGMRQVRDYVLTAEERRVVAWLGTTSPFNVTTEALSLRTFTRADVEELLAQHTAATGQPFEPAAVEHIYHLSQGQPWLANALADQIVDRDVRDRTVPITPAHVDAAKETIIVERRTHIDSLVARLREPRVRRILDPMLAGQAMPADMLDDDIAYLTGIGLVRVEKGNLEIANPIYREVIPRALTYVQQIGIRVQESALMRPDGSLDMPKLMAEWQKFWRKDGHLSAEGFPYRESGPHMMLMAFLQRVINGGGRIEREYGIGRGALDLLVEWRGRKYPIEVKLRRDTETEEDALEQVARYLDGLGCEEGWLVMFDLRSTLPWTERVWNRDVTFEGKLVHIVGC